MYDSSVFFLPILTKLVNLVSGVVVLYLGGGAELTTVELINHRGLRHMTIPTHSPVSTSLGINH